jgi:small conductance mechanosensitive channel
MTLLVTLFDRADPLVEHALRWGGALAVVAFAFAVNTGLRVAIRFLTRRAVRRALAGRGHWIVRHPRAGEEGLTEQRRRQRADATAHMLARIVGVVVITITVAACSALVRVDPLVVLSSAGFLGAALAFGGQAVIRDWLTGLVALLEDRYAIGDRITVRVGADDYSGAVETLTGVSLRLRLDDGSAWHTGHGSVESVTNHSQHLVDNAIEIPAHVWHQLDETMLGRAVTAASHDLGLTDVLLVSDIEAEARGDGTTTVTVRASRALNQRQRSLLAERISDCKPAASP